MPLLQKDMKAISPVNSIHSCLLLHKNFIILVCQVVVVGVEAVVAAMGRMDKQAMVELKVAMATIRGKMLKGLLAFRPY